MPGHKLFDIFNTIILCNSVVAIWYVYIGWRRGKKAQQILKHKDRIVEATLQIEQMLSFERYFSFNDEQLFIGSFHELREVIPSGFQKLPLDEDILNNLSCFVDIFDSVKTVRRKYNDDFVKSESEKYFDFFSSLENYPLSPDQIEAIIRDEDNNLVIAGAGTGKTTTISAKVAYLLKKGLARPEELLIISFTKNAVKEMYERCLRFCKDIPEAEKLDVRTFNSFGYFVNRACSKEELHVAFDGDDQKAKEFLQETFDRLCEEDKQFQKKAINFVAFFNRPERDEFAFKTKDEFIKHEQSFKNVTLDGNKVNSKEEMEIGNFFCLHGVNYEYEKHFPLEPEDRSSSHAAYHPDFFLTDYNIWHEHYGIDRQGNVPSWFSVKPGYATAKDYYHALIHWKEGIHRKYNTKLIKTYSYENKEGKLLSNLKKSLIDNGVTLTAREPEEIIELVRNSSYYQDFIDLIHTFLGLMKSNGKSPDQIPIGLFQKRLKVFMAVFKPLYLEYERELRKRSQIDYNDMVNRASSYFKNGEFTKRYKYILVDEFQDMSLGRYELLKGVRGQNPQVKLYAVGDDWQSIFRFTGSDISIITEFEKHFGFTSRTAILKTYRFNEQILKASSDFIQKNPAQIRKKLISNDPSTGNSFEFFSKNTAAENADDQKTNIFQIDAILEGIVSRHPNATVFFIGRYHHNVPENIDSLRSKFPDLVLNYFTAHRVKGMTCDYAILLDLDSGTLGFPSEMADDPILNCLLHEGDSFENAEERRVFYVALTRARYKNYLVYNLQSPSKFLTELGESLEFEDPYQIKCPECNGLLLKRKGPYNEFYGCSNYPQCNVMVPAMPVNTGHGTG